MKMDCLVRLLIKQGDLGRVLSTVDNSIIQKTFSHCQTSLPCAIKINTESVHNALGVILKGYTALKIQHKCRLRDKFFGD